MKKDRFQEILAEINNEKLEQEGQNQNSHIMVVDGLNMFIRVFSAIPSLNDDGDHIGGVVGFLRSLAAVIRQHKPTRCIVVFDGKGGSARRRKIYPDYKANRAVKTRLNRHEEFDNIEDEQASMRRQFSRMIEYLNLLPLTVMAVDNIEADDAIAYIANEIYTKASQKVTIVSTDRDFLQLVNNRIQVWSPVKKKLYTPEVVVQETDIHCDNYLLYRTFSGDKSDNIPGVDGVGLKTLIKNYPMLQTQKMSLDEIKEYTADQVNNSKLKIYQKVQAGIDSGILDRNYRLMQLQEVDISGSAKMLILDKTRETVHRTNILEFKKLFMLDKLYTSIKDVDSWMLNSFNSLNAYASI